MVAVLVFPGALLRIIMASSSIASVAEEGRHHRAGGSSSPVAYAWLAGIRSSYGEVDPRRLPLGVPLAPCSPPRCRRRAGTRHPGHRDGIAGAGNSAPRSLRCSRLVGGRLRLTTSSASRADLSCIVLVAFLFRCDAPDALAPVAGRVHEGAQATRTHGGSCSSFGHLRRFRRPASSLVIYFHTQYGLDAKTAGYFTAACVFAGSMVRPIGGNVADRVGGKSLPDPDVPVRRLSPPW